MMNYRFYIFSTLGIVLFFALLTVIFTPYFIKSSAISLLDTTIESSIREARQAAMLTSSAIQNEIPKDKIIESIQASIENTDNQDAFISIFDWSGKHICYPDITEVGNEASSEAALFGMEEAMTGATLYESLSKNNETTGANEVSQIVYLLPISSNSDWIVACHVNTSKVTEKISQLRSSINFTFLTIGLVVLLFMLGIIRLITVYYERQLALKTVKLEDGVLNLSKLNASLENYQKNLFEYTSSQTTSNNDVVEVEVKAKERILTYVRNELLPIAMEDIAYIYVENTITYVIRKNGKRSTSNESLDQIYMYLNERTFFRANRQIIVAISAIDKIIKFGNSKLKIDVRPVSEIDIIIGKNKAAAFKQWLDL